MDKIIWRRYSSPRQGNDHAAHRDSKNRQGPPTGPPQSLSFCPWTLGLYSHTISERYMYIHSHVLYVGSGRNCKYQTEDEISSYGTKLIVQRTCNLPSLLKQIGNVNSIPDGTTIFPLDDRRLDELNVSKRLKPSYHSPK